MKRKRTSSNRTLSNRVKSQSHSQKGNVNQSASGVLKDCYQEEGRPFEKSIEPLEIANITHFSGIPDFIKPTRSLDPIIVQSPSSLQCIDGWEKIEEARQKGEQQITCEIFHTDQDSDIDVALWKTSIRMRPPGGRCSYAESIRNVRQIFITIEASQEDPKIYSHGGDRRSQDFTDNNREENIRILLERRLDKSVKTINKYINHAEFLDDITLDAIIRSEIQIKKDFFEKVQRKKRTLVRDLKCDGSSDETITNEVSQKMPSWLHEYQTTGDISSDDSEPDGTELEDGHDNAGEEIIGNNQSNALKTFTPWQGRDSGPQTTPSEEDIKRAIDMATIPLIRCRNRSPMDLELLLRQISKAIDHLADVNQMAEYIKDNKSNEKKV